MTITARQPIFIIGYMASGKTTFGRALAKRLGIRFIDLDFYIEQRFRTTIARIFAERGEEEFRRLESNMLREVGEMNDVVVACGGGTPCFHGNMQYMLAHGTTIFMDATIERITERLLRNRSRRPLMADADAGQITHRVAEGLARRMPFYSQAAIAIGSDKLENRAQIDETINSFITNHLKNNHLT